MSSITHYENPKFKLDSQWGRITYLEWCELESARLNAAGAHTSLGWRDGYVAIVRA